MRAHLRHSSTKEDALESAFNTWIDSMRTKDPLRTVALYDPEAYMLATLAAAPLRTQSERLDYFQNLLSRPNMHATVQDTHARFLGETHAIISGLYAFHYEEQGIPITLPARFSFVYSWKNNRWLIIEHHSSQVPE